MYLPLHSGPCLAKAGQSLPVAEWSGVGYWGVGFQRLTCEGTGGLLISLVLLGFF